MKKIITLLATITLLSAPLALAKSGGAKSGGNSMNKSGSKNQNQYKYQYQQKNKGDATKNQYKQKNKNKDGFTYEIKKGQKQGNY